jgi:hypothetical protein
MRFWKLSLAALVGIALLAAGSIFGASYYYTSQRGAGCASCHEMTVMVGAIHHSAHGTATCMNCHNASLSTKLRHTYVHLSGHLPERIHLRDVDVVEMTEKCQSCHQHEYATWHAGPHSATYSEIFADPVHNRKRRLMDDCLRCHGAHFRESIRELVQPQTGTGPWHLVRGGLADQPAIPCQSCHGIHREGMPPLASPKRASVAADSTWDSLAFFDRREQAHFSAKNLPIPEIWDGPRIVTVSRDSRQALCYQCHAPRESETGSEAAGHHWGPQVASGDDRTPVGVHEGISCVACHSGHNENARASCKTCHPQMSHCGLDVETMDTTYADSQSAHNIHWVRCTDCHQHGAPRMKAAALQSHKAQQN